MNHHRLAPGEKEARAKERAGQRKLLGSNRAPKGGRRAFPEIKPADLEVLSVQRMRLSAAVRAPGTLAAYAKDWRLFCEWCTTNSLPSLPVAKEHLALYLAAELNTGYRITTCTRRVAAIVYYHRAAGLPSPCAGGEIALLLSGAQRIRREKPLQKEPISIAHLQQICATPALDPVSIRNRAVLLFGFATALRRSNIVALDLADLEFSEQGFVVHVSFSKTDQKGRGFDVAVPVGQHDTCPVKALLVWLLCRGNAPGPLFRRVHAEESLGPNLGRLNSYTISRIVKAAVKKLGLDPGAYAAHSLRAGLVTEGFGNGVDHVLIMKQTGHKSFKSLERYFREKDLFKSNTISSLGL